MRTTSYEITKKVRDMLASKYAESLGQQKWMPFVKELLVITFKRRSILNFLYNI